MTLDQLLAYSPTPQSMVKRSPAEPFRPLYTFPELMEAIKFGGNGANSNEIDGKNRIVAGILALLLGWLGVQYFYLGKIKGGLITILLTVVTCGLWEVLTFVQGILILVMTPQEFARKFVYTDKVLPLF